jgi:signal transduction histidine kinase
MPPGKALRGGSGMSDASPEDAHRRQLLEQSIEITQLAGSLAHEIRNPLSTIRMNMDLLAEDLVATDTPSQRRALAKVHVVQEQCRRLENLLDNFLNFTKTSGLNLRAANLNALVGRVLDFLRPRMEAAGVDVRRYLDPELPSVMLDPEKLYTALLNLAINALQSMPDGGQFVVRTRRSPGGVSLDLIDTGCGMNDETLIRIFKPFFTTKRDGTGLGLPWTRRIVEAHQGTISVQSAVDRGTQFTIELPVPKRLSTDE